MLRLRLLSLSAIATVLFASTSLSAQQAAVSQGPVSPRIVAPVDESKLVALPGRVSLLARSEFDLGRASASTQMTSVRLVLSRSPQQEAALERFMADQLDSSLPNYRKWLSPDQFGKLYGPSDADIQTLVTWLQSRGFTVQSVPQGRVSIAFAGSVSQMEAAFHTEIHSFNANGEEFLSNTSNPKVPSALASVISGIAGLNTIKPRAHNVPAKSGMYDPLQKHFVSADSHAAGPKPLLTVGSSSSGYELFLVPADAATIYDTPNNFNAGFSSGSSFTGAGVTIGIGGDAPIQATTVASYRSQFLGTSTLPTITTVGTAPTSTEDTDEAYIDTELSGGLAPGATINFYTAVNLSDAINQAIEDNTVDIFSLSFGNCEVDLSTADNALLSGWWQQAASQGIAVTVSTGDSGAAGCDNENTQQTAQYGLQVNGFASTPYNIAVGGTDFPGLLSNFSGYVSTTNGNYYGSALGYIPESTWNNSVVTDGLLAQNTPYKNSSAETDIVGGSGGASSCSTNANNATSTTIATCTSGYAKPSWQTGAGVPTDAVRDLPDISLFASNGFDGAAWLVCTDDSFTQGGVTYITNCEAQNGGGFSFSGFGGTSTSAPAFAGILALVQQYTGSRLGQAARNLYRLYNDSNASAIFHDTTTGNISVPCTSGTPNCSKNSAGYYFLTGYNAATGYDLATGLGSVNVTNLIQYWNVVSGTATSTVTVTPAATAVTTNQTLSVAVTVTGASGTPTGTVTLKGGGYTSPSQPLSDGTYTISIPIGSLAPGTDTLTVTYSGDAVYATQAGTASVTVTALTPTVAVTPAESNINTNETLSVTVSVSGSGPAPTGQVFVNILGGVNTLANGTTTFIIGSNILPVGTDTITVQYEGDGVYTPGNGSGTVNVTQYIPLTPTVTVTPASKSIGANLPLSVTVRVTGSGATPTGYANLMSGSWNGGSQMLAAGSYTFTIPGGSLTAGTDTITSQYSGDTNYASATGSASVAVSAAPTPTITVNSASSSIDTGQPLAVAIKVAGVVGSPTPTGTVTITYGNYYTSSAATLSSGSASITVPSNTFLAGTDTLSISYSGDSIYTPTTSSASVTVGSSAYTLSGSTAAAVNPGSTATSTITINSSTYYQGIVALYCSLTNAPAGAVDSPTCALNGAINANVTLTGGATSATATATFSTTAGSNAAAHVASSEKPHPGRPSWMKTGATTLLALLIFFSIPARRRAWRAIAGSLVLMATFGALSACGSTNGGGGGGGSSAGTTAGSYTFTITGNGTPSVTPEPAITVTVTVN